MRLHENWLPQSVANEWLTWLWNAAAFEPHGRQTQISKLFKAGNKCCNILICTHWLHSLRFPFPCAIVDGVWRPRDGCCIFVMLSSSWNEIFFCSYRYHILCRLKPGGKMKNDKLFRFGGKGAFNISWLCILHWNACNIVWLYWATGSGKSDTEWISIPYRNEFCAFCGLSYPICSRVLLFGRIKLCLSKDTDQECDGNSSAMATIIERRVVGIETCANCSSIDASRTAGV